MAWKAIYNKLSTGKIEDVVKDVEVYLETANQLVQPVSIIRLVCDSIMKISHISQVQAQSATRICDVCLQTILHVKAGDVIEVDQKLTAALFHIARIIGKDDIEAFSKLIYASVPVFKSMPNAKDPKQVEILAQFSILASNYFAKVEEHVSESNHPLESNLYQYWEMMITVSSLSRNNPSVLFITAQKIILFYSGKVSAANQIKEFADKIILSLKNFFIDNAENKQPHLDANKQFYNSLKCALRTFRFFTTRNEYEMAFKIWKDMTSTLKVALPTSCIEYKAICVIDKTLTPFLCCLKTIPLSEIPFSELQEALVSLKKSPRESIDGSKALEQAAFVISSVLSVLVSYWIKNFQKVKSVFPVTLLSSLEQFFTELVMVLRRSCCFLCANASKECASGGDVFYAFQVELALLFLCAWVINWDAETRPMLIKVCENSFGRCQELLTVAKEKDCLQSIDFCIPLCDRAHAVAAQNKDDPVISKKLLERARDWYIEFNKARGYTLPNQSTAKKIMKCLAMMHEDLKEYIAALEASALALVLECLSPEKNENNYLLRLWNDLVANVPDEYIPLVTFVKTNEAVKDFFGDAKQVSYDYFRLFITELMALGCGNPQKFSVLMKSWKTKKELNLSPLQKIQSAAFFLSALAFCQDLEMVQEFISSFKAEEYHKLLKTIPSEDRPVALCALAELFYCRFFIDKKLHQAASKRRVEDAKTFKPLPKAVLSTTDVIDKNDVCNLTPTFEGIALSQEASLLNNLDIALKYWDDSLKSGLNASHLDNRQLLKCAEYLVVAAQIFRLFGHFLKEKRAWEICRRFGQQVRNDQLMLRAVSGLMELSCCDAGWIQRCQTIAADLADEPTAQDVLHIYKNSYIVYCFSNGKLEEGAAILKEVLKSNNEWAWFYIKSEFLYTTILFSTPLSTRMCLFPEEHDDMFTIARNCYAKLAGLLQSSGDKGSWSNVPQHTSVADLLFSVCLWLGYTYLEMMLPREARCFLKIHLLLTQRMGLAVRTAECLSLLGKVDMLVQKIEDGLVKVEGMKQILEVESTEKEEVADDIPIYRDEEDMDRLRVAPKIGNQTGASPVLVSGKFQMPDFASHKTSCCCYHCSHVLLHTLWLDMGYIEAAVLSSECQVRRARNFYSESMKLADIFRKKHEKLLSGFCKSSAVLDDFIRSETNLRLRYGDLLILEGKDDERSVNQAWEINERLSTSLAKAQSKYTLLLTDVGEQRITLIDIRNQQVSAQVSKQQQRSSQKVCTTGGDVTPNMSKRSNFVKTPVPSNLPGEKARTPLEPITFPNEIHVKEKAFIQARGALPLAFHLSDSDDETSGENGTVELKPEENAKGKEDRKSVVALKFGAKFKGKEDRKEREKKPKTIGRSTTGKELKTNLKPASAAASSGLEVRIGANDVISDFENDGQMQSPFVIKCLSQPRTLRKINEVQKKVKNTDGDSNKEVEVLSWSVRAARSTVGSKDVEKAKTRKTATASGKSDVNSERSNFLKTPFPSNLPGKKACIAVEPITPPNVIPVKEKAFSQARGVLPVTFHLSDSDDEASGTAVLKLEANDKRKEDRRKKGETSGRSTKEKASRTNLRSKLEFSIHSEDVISDSEDEFQKVHSPFVFKCLVQPQTSVKNKKK